MRWAVSRTWLAAFFLRRSAFGTGQEASLAKGGFPARPLGDRSPQATTQQPPQVCLADVSEPMQAADGSIEMLGSV